jgi:hypothetical protein
MNQKESNEDEFWGEYTPAEEIREQIEDDSNVFTKTASISYDGEQHFVRFPKEIAELKDLSNYKIEFTGIERPEKENKIRIELVEK